MNEIRAFFHTIYKNRLTIDTENIKPIEDIIKRSSICPKGYSEGAESKSLKHKTKTSDNFPRKIPKVS